MPEASPAQEQPGKEARRTAKKKLRMFLIPCSCGASFAVSEDYDGQGMHLRSFIPCPKCGKRHDPRNRLLRSIIRTSTSGKLAAAERPEARRGKPCLYTRHPVAPSPP